MKFSFSTLGCPYYTFEEMIDLAKRSGYTGVEFRIYKGTEDLRVLEEFQRPGIGATRRLFQEAGLQVACVSSSARFAYPDPENLKTQLKLAEDFMQIASDLECPYVRVFGGPYPLNFTDRPKAEPFIEEYRASIPPEKIAGLTREECDKWIMESLGKVGDMGKKFEPDSFPLTKYHRFSRSLQRPLFYILPVAVQNHAVSVFRLRLCPRLQRVCPETVLDERYIYHGQNPPSL